MPAEDIYIIDDLREIGFVDSGEIPITDASKFVGSYGMLYRRKCYGIN